MGFNNPRGSAAAKPGMTYYPVNPLGPFSGPRASDYPNGTATPMTTVPGTPAPTTPTPTTPTPSPSPPGRDNQQRIAQALMGWPFRGSGVFNGRDILQARMRNDRPA